MTTVASPDRRLLSMSLRRVLTLAAVIDLILGGLFLVGPETGLSLWPAQVSPLMSRFIGAIVVASGVGVLVATRQGTWEGARALFYVGLVYDLLTLAALLYHLFFKDAPPVFWVYAALDVIYLIPIAYVIWTCERTSRS